MLHRVFLSDTKLFHRINSLTTQLHQDERTTWVVDSCTGGEAVWDSSVAYLSTVSEQYLSDCCYTKIYWRISAVEVMPFHRSPFLNLWQWHPSERSTIIFLSFLTNNICQNLSGFVRSRILSSNTKNKKLVFYQEWHYPKHRYQWPQNWPRICDGNGGGILGVWCNGCCFTALLFNVIFASDLIIMTWISNYECSQMQLV